MSEMIYRLVKAMDRAWEQYLKSGTCGGNIREAYARAMLEELGSPTQEMIDAAVFDSGVRAWHTMLREALK